jgi:ribosome maturation factor RimP
MDKLQVSEKVREIAERIAAENGLDIVHVDVAGGDRSPAVRIFIDKPAGVTHEDCSLISHHVGTILDVEDFIPSAYTLEVSSPGLERELFNLKDYEKYAGHLAKLKTRQPINNQRNFRGKIVGVEGENVIFEDKTSGQVTVPFDLIAKTNLEIDVEEEFKRSSAK